MLTIQADLKKDKGRKELQLELERKTALLPVLIGGPSAPPDDTYAKVRTLCHLAGRARSLRRPAAPRVQVAKALTGNKDKNVGKHLGVIINPMTPYTDIRTSIVRRAVGCAGCAGRADELQVELFRAVGNDKVQEIVSRIVSVAAFNFVNCESVPIMISEASLPQAP
jgi:hypothetical protein